LSLAAILGIPDSTLKRLYSATVNSLRGLLDGVKTRGGAVRRSDPSRRSRASGGKAKGFLVRFLAVHEFGFGPVSAAPAIRIR